MQDIPGAEAFVRMLQLHGVKHIFGLCGDTSLPLYDALYRLDHGMQHILCRDERSAAYMADAYARVSGRVGVCEGPSGGGATYILPGVVEANESSIPVLAVTTDISVSSRGRYTLTELDQQSLFRPLTKWNTVLDRAADIPRALRAAFSHMTSGRPGAAHIGLPFDVQKDAVRADEVWADAALGLYPSRRSAPDADSVARAARLLVEAKRPLIICGGGVVISAAEAELQALAERLGAAVATTISGQGSLSEEHPLAVGVVGSNGGTPQTRGIVQQADVVFFIGCRAGSVTTERWRYPAPGQAKIVHLDADPAVIHANYRADAALVCDARLGLAALFAQCDALGAGGAGTGDVVVGDVGWRRVTTGPNSATWNIGIGLMAKERGKGYGTRAQRLLVDYLFSYTQFHRIEAGTETTNIAEQRSLEKVGFTREGVVRGACFRAGKWRDMVLYSILRTDVELAD